MSAGAANLAGARSGSSKTSRISRPSLKGAQGGPLPSDRSPLSAYPVGCCVLLRIGPKVDEGIDPDHLAWHLVAFRIGVGLPHLRRLVSPPTSVDWNAGMGGAAEARLDLVVHESRWPHRSGTAGQDAGSEDPLTQDQEIDGSLLLNFTGRAQVVRAVEDRALVEWISDCGIVASIEDLPADLRGGDRGGDRGRSEFPCPFCPAPPSGRLPCVVRARRSCGISDVNALASGIRPDAARDPRHGAATRPRSEGTSA